MGWTDSRKHQGQINEPLSNAHKHSEREREKEREGERGRVRMNDSMREDSV